MSLGDSIEIDLRTLASENKKKSGDLKSLSERAISLLRQSPDLPIEPILQVLHSAKSTSSPKSCSTALSILQKLLTSNPSPPISPSLSYLKSMLSDIQDEPTQLKVLQTLMLILNPFKVQITPDLTNTIWEIFILLQTHKSSLIRNTASATLQQLANITFSNLKTEKTDDLVASAAILLINSCEVAKSRVNELVRIKPEILTLLLTLTESSKSTLSHTPQLSKILQIDLTQVLSSHFSEEMDEHIGTKIIKIAQIVCEVTKSSPDLLKSTLILLNNRKNPEWLTIVCLEFWNSVLSNIDLLKFLFSETEIYSKLLDTLSKVSHEMFAQTEDLRQVGVKNKVRLMAEIICHWVECISIITEEEGIVLGEPCNPRSSGLGGELVSSIWKPLLPILSIIVSNSFNETILQTMLNSYQTLVNLTGTLNLPMAREALLASLCQFCIPSHSSTLTHKNLHICKTLFNITHCLGFALDSKAWHKVLDTLYKLDFQLHNLSKIEDQDLASDISILTSAMDSLFKNTHIWPDSTITDLMSALGQITLEFMETLSTNDKKMNGGKLFGLEKMIIVAQNNLDRIDLYWDSLIAYLDCISNYKYPEIRILGNTSISRIILSAFKKFEETPPKSIQTKWKSWQRTLLLVLHDLLGSPYIDTQEFVFSVVYSILQSCGSSLDEGGWGMLLFILSKIDVGVLNSGKEGFKCLQLIVSDFLQCEKLFPSFERLISCVSKYAHSDDSTQAIGAVGMYWNIADFLGKVGKDKMDLWWIILEELKFLGEDDRLEVRHSALSSLHIALSMHGSMYTADNWQRVMQDVVLGLFDRISEKYLRVQKNGHSRSLSGSLQSNEKQWEESYNIFTQNLGRIFITYLMSMKKLEVEVLDEPSIGKNWENLVVKLKEGIDFGTVSIITAVLKTIKELISCTQVASLFFCKWNSSWALLESIEKRFLTSTSLQIQYKQISIILEVLTLLYNTKFENIFEDSSLSTLFSIILSLLKSTTTETQSQYNKLLPEQREIWEFTEKILYILIEKNKDLAIFAQFITNFINISPKDNESFCRRALEIMEKMLENFFDKSERFISGFLNAIEKILVSRFQVEVDNLSGKVGIPIWYTAGESFLKILGKVFYAPHYAKIADIYSGLINPSVNKLGKNELDSLCKAAEDLDIRLINELTELLLTRPVADSQTLTLYLEILNSGYESFYKSVHAQELTLQKTFTSTSFDCLLQLSSAKSICADLACPILVSRCKEIIGKFSKDEKLSGQMPLPRIKLLEMLDILDAIRKHEVPEGILKKPGKKAHLLELFPQLCELITAKDQDVKESLKQIFLEVSRNL